MIEHIVAVDEKHGIAKDGVIPWDLPGDVRFFHEHIQGKRLLMGRETYEQIGRKVGAYMYVVSSREVLEPRLETKWGEIVHDLSLFLKENGDEPLTVIGGEGIYRATLEVAQKLLITRLKGDFDCDRFYPEGLEGFMRTNQFGPLQENGISYSFETYERV